MIRKFLKTQILNLHLFLCISFFITLFASNIACAQESDSTSAPLFNTSQVTTQFTDIHLDLTKELLNQLVPVDSLIQLAIKNNPALKAQDALVDAGNQQIKLGRREWQNGVFLSFNENLGNQTLFYNTNQEPVGTQSQSTTTGYRLGLNVNIPLYWFFARTSRINIYKDELEVRKQTGEKLKLDLAREVVSEYNSILSTHQILLIASTSRSTARMLIDMADRQFKQGDISIGDYSSIMGLASKSESDYEIAKRDFYTWYEQLERLVGVRLDTLVRKK